MAFSTLDTITKYATLENAQAYAADKWGEPVLFVADLTGWSVDNWNFDSMCERREDAFDELLAEAEEARIAAKKTKLEALEAK